MKRFRFALQPVLDHRHRIEEERQQELAVLKRALNEETVRLAALHNEFRTYSNRLRREHSAMNVEDLRLHYAHLEFLDRAITEQEAVVAQKKVEHEAGRVRLVEASRDKKALEKLRERRREAHMLEQDRAEQRELDDANSRRYQHIIAGGRP
ncbi:MAG: flagellar export protein FliJ [Candidatus Eremiobacteraeota bacterium]|nr:flagellar export protein FliJ [Candidatus Eremiobacteraeota bacterium]